MKKLLSLVLALVLVLSLSVTAFAASGYPNPMYVDISKCKDSGKTVSSVTGTSEMDGSDTYSISVTHVSGDIYSCDMEWHQSAGSVAIQINYTDNTSDSFLVESDGAKNTENLYTIEGDSTGTWSVYTPASAGPTVTNGNKDVTGKYVAGQDGGTIYGVDIKWGNMVFTYTNASKGTWNADSHQYDNAKAAAWSYDEGANVITVTNHSNVPVAVTPSYTKGEGYADANMTFSTAKLTVATADNGTNGAAGTAQTGTITVTPEGKLAKNDSTSATTGTTIGTITLTLEDASATITSFAADKSQYTYMIMGSDNECETLDDVTFTATYSNGDTKALKIGDAGLTVTANGREFNTSSTGSYVYTAAYEGKTCTFTMVVDSRDIPPEY